MSTAHTGRHRPPPRARWHRRAVGSVLALFALSASTPIPAPPTVVPDPISDDTDVLPVIPSPPQDLTLVVPVATSVLITSDVVLAEVARFAQEAKLANAVKAAKVRADKAAALARSRRYSSPLWTRYTITSGYGFRWGRMHPAIDLAVPVGTKVHALTAGRVIFAGWSSEGYGYMVLVRHWDGAVSRYAHNSRLLVSTGDVVTSAQVLALTGDTGNSTGPHLHLEVWPDGYTPVSPRPWLKRHGVNL